jgi:hypothetical protein
MKFVGLTECPGESSYLFRERLILIRPSQDAVPFLQPPLLVAARISQLQLQANNKGN